MENFIIIAVCVVIIVLAVGYIIKQKKKGIKCIGCSACSCNCAKDNNSDCGYCDSCNQNTDKSE